MADAGDLQPNCLIQDRETEKSVFTCLKVAAEEVSQKCHPARWRRKRRKEPCSSTSVCSRSPRPQDRDWWLECSMRVGVSRRTLRASSRASIETAVALTRQPRRPPQSPRPPSASHKCHCGSAFQEQEQVPDPELLSHHLLPTRSACPSACTSSTPPLPSPSFSNPRHASTSWRSLTSHSVWAEQQQLLVVVDSWLG